MAVQKVKPSFVDDLTIENVANVETPVVAPVSEPEFSKTDLQPAQVEEPAPSRAPRKKDVANWGRPRKSIIEGEEEVATSIQLPKAMLTVLRREAKKQKKSLKLLVGELIMEKYGHLIKK